MIAFPGILFYIVFKYVPMFGLSLAFLDFNPFLGISGSEWTGWDNFRRIIDNPEVYRVLWNTLLISFLQILFAFPIPILLAVMLNELRNDFVKRMIQSIIYLPHFLSWVVVVGICFIFFRGEGIINGVLTGWLGLDAVPFLTDPSFFKPMVVAQVIWKEAGWGTIIFLASLAAVNPELHESATIDGAGRFQQIWHVVLPAIRSTIVIMLILRLGSVLDSGFEQIFLMLNPFNRETGEVLDTYVFTKGIESSDYSFATAVGLFKGAVGLILVLSANSLAKRFGEEGVY
ncbi:protein lplB [Paenibacillus agaridevorans]|uniref:Protein lplB n=1 Tax=Paenibacillus agaridevorans TaxID=171404 RepID=A0A2R5EGU5_9BACL|nr:protein lplB [Paenibacillus agaridevorans]